MILSIQTCYNFLLALFLGFVLFIIINSYSPKLAVCASKLKSNAMSHITPSIFVTATKYVLSMIHFSLQVVQVF